MKFTFVHQHRTQWPVTAVCRVLSVSRSGYAAWQNRQCQPSQSQQADARLVLQIKAAHHQGRKTYGSPRVHRVLRDRNVRVSRKRVARLMLAAGLRGVCRGRVKPRTTQSNPLLPVAHNLLERGFTLKEIGGLNRALCGDITYVATAQGWLYLATVQDLFSRRIIGWALSESLEAEIVQKAFENAMKTREGNRQASQSQCRLFHSDRGSQYGSGLFKKALKKHGFAASMSGKGDCWDNAVAESFFGTFKSELVAQQPGGRFASKAQAYELTADYIENFYNRVRLHSTLDYRSPVAFELSHQAGMLSAF